MFYALFLLFVCTALAYLSRNKQFAGADNSNKTISQRTIDLSSIAFVALLIILVCFAGLRTFMNDTATYLSSFEEKVQGGLSGIKSIDWSIGANPLFHFYQILIKSVLPGLYRFFSKHGLMSILFYKAPCRCGNCSYQRA